MHRLTITSAFAAIALAAVPASTTAKPSDRDRDGLPDRWERKYQLTSAKADRDRDGLTNREEFRAGSNPRRRDTDRDRLHDAVEVEHGLDPASRDSDDDGIRDDDEGAGTVKSFADGVLVVELAGGGELSGRVDDATDIECDSAGEESDDREDGAPIAQASNRDEDDDEDDERDDDEQEQEPNDDEGDDDQPQAGAHPDPVTGHPTPAGDDDDDCGPEALTYGTVVEEAELDEDAAEPRFEEIELLR